MKISLSDCMSLDADDISIKADDFSYKQWESINVPLSLLKKKIN